MIEKEWVTKKISDLEYLAEQYKTKYISALAELRAMRNVLSELTGEKTEEEPVAEKETDQQKAS